MRLSSSLLTLALTTVAAAQTPSWHRLPVLTNLGQKSLAYDAARQRMVLFECSGRAAVSRTWEWVHERWSLRHTANTPPPRDGYAMAFDAARNRVVLFGGCTEYQYYVAPGALLADTWEYDGVDWTQRSPIVSPPPQTGHKLVFDPANGAVLLIGGNTWPWAPTTDWSYDGTTWTQVAASGFPPHRVALVADPVRSRIVAILPSYAVPPVLQHFEWDGASWTQQQPTALPTSREGMSLTFDASLGGAVLHGGYSSSTTLDDRWLLLAGSWLPLGPSGLDLAGHVSVFDVAGNRTFAVGGFRIIAGYGSLGHSGTHLWNGAAWSSTEQHLAWDRLASLAFDAATNSLVGVHEHRTLEWHQDHWQSAPPPPALLRSNGVAYDPVRQRLVAVGVQPFLVDAVWERTATTWSAPIPTATTIHSNPVWHAGLGAVVALSSTHVVAWNGTSWQSVTPLSTAGTRTLAYDALRNELVLIEPTTSATQTWNGTTWNLHAAAALPPARTNYSGVWSATYDASRGRVVLFGGRNPVTGPNVWNFFQFFDDLWEWDGATWTQRVLPNAPPAREGATLAFDPSSQRLLLFGGNRVEQNGATLMFGDVWAIDAAAPANVQTIGSGCGRALRLTASSPHVGAPAFSLDLLDAAANTLCAFAASTTPGSTTLAGCTSYVPTLDVLSFTIATPGGFASVAGALPASLQGFSFTAQAAALDPAAPGFAFSPALRVTVGR